VDAGPGPQGHFPTNKMQTAIGYPVGQKKGPRKRNRLSYGHQGGGCKIRCKLRARNRGLQKGTCRKSGKSRSREEARLKRAPYVLEGIGRPLEGKVPRSLRKSNHGNATPRRKIDGTPKGSIGTENTGGGMIRHVRCLSLRANEQGETRFKK